MSYVDMQYTGPEWNNSTPPPLNAANLLDISRALEAVNITQDDRSALSVEQEDKLGTVLTKLNTALKNFANNSSSSTLTTVGNAFSPICYGSYIGNGGRTASISYRNSYRGAMKAKAFIVANSVKADGNFASGIGMCTNNSNTGLMIYSGNNIQANSVEVTFSVNSISFETRESSGGLNNSGKTYTYLIFG